VTKRSTQPARAAQGDRVLTDPRAIRALAHPARLAVLEELSDGQEMTATECGAAAGITASAMSYHLRALAKWGFVERAESRDGRERPWRATATGWRIEPMTDQLQATAASAVTSTMFERVSADLARWFEHEPDEPAEWTAVAQVSSRAAWLTSDEAAELSRCQQEILDAARKRTAADRPSGARRVRALSIVVPVQYES
jgi:DNA-binding transcriptional ArsR family regulator